MWKEILSWFLRTGESGGGGHVKKEGINLQCENIEEEIKRNKTEGGFKNKREKKMEKERTKIKGN